MAEANEQVPIAATRRQLTGKGHNRRLREQELVPAVVYGCKKEPVSVSVAPRDVVAILDSARGRNTSLALSVEGEDTPRLALIKDFHIHPWKRKLMHVDFWEVRPDQPVTVSVPIERINRSELERAGWEVVMTRPEIIIKCLPGQIPVSLEFDMSTVSENQFKVMVSEVPLPDGIEAVYKHDFGLIQLVKARITLDIEGEGEEEEGEGEDEAEEPSEE